MPGRKGNPTSIKGKFFFMQPYLTRERSRGKRGVGREIFALGRTVKASID